MLWPMACAVALLASAPLGARAQDVPDPFPEGSDVEPAWRVGAFLQNQTGVFVAHDKEAFGDPKNPRSPTNHGGNFGTLSMCRFTFQLDADWRPTKRIWTHVTLRLARSLAVTADEGTQVPVAGYAGDENKSRRKEWVRDKYYTETDIREFFVNFRAASWLDIRLGRQLVAWGESGNSRLLDVVNPVNSTWHSGIVESYEDQRMPLWMVRIMADVPALRGALDIVWVPMLSLMERPEDTVTVPLTFANAWGLPTPPKQRDDSVGPDKINSKPLLIPHDFGTDSRVGARWKGNAGKALTYSLMYYWTHQMSPPIPKYTQRPGTGADGWDGVSSEGFTATRGTYDVFLEFPRQHILGFSLEGQVPFPLGTMLKLEGSVELNRTYAMYSAAAKGNPTYPGKTVEQVLFQHKEYPVIQYALTLQQPFWIRPVNREEPFVLVFQFQHTAVPGIDDLDKDNAVVDVPGYDTTVASRHQFKFIGALFTSFLKGTITPKITAGFIPKTTHWSVKRTGEIEVWNLKHQSMSHGSGFATFSLAFKLMDSMRATVAYNRFFGDEPYDGLGFYRDRDEVNLMVKYQF
jgi:hypothetical protein